MLLVCLLVAFEPRVAIGQLARRPVGAFRALRHDDLHVVACLGSAGSTHLRLARRAADDDPDGSGGFPFVNDHERQGVRAREVVSHEGR